MSDAPVVFKRTKRKPIPRAREKTPDSENGADISEKREESPSVLATKLKNKVKRAAPKSRLSFGGDEEVGGEEVFKIKNPSQGRTLVLGRRPASPSHLLPTSLDQASLTPRTNGGPVYDKAYLSELKASTPSSRPPERGNDSYDIDMSVDLESSPLPNPSSDILVDSEMAIPSESSILNAKQKRERLRTTVPSGDDYISLSVTKHIDMPQGPHPESRLAREEDELGEGDDEFAEYTSAQERIALGKKSRKIEAGKRRDAMKEMMADAEEEDEETMEWEQEQLRRGGHNADDIDNRNPVKPTYKAAPIPISTPIPTLNPAIARLTQSLTTLTTSHAKNTSSMISLAEERVQLDLREKEMREMIDKAEEKRSWFSAFREWVESVATFLDEKFPQLEKLEDDHIWILKERADMISKRRRLDDEDDLSIFLGSLPAQPADEEVDGLGRTIPTDNPLVARKTRRMARTVRRSRRHPTQSNVEEGYSTDSSLSPSEYSDYKTALQKLSSDAQKVLSDVRAVEFRDPILGLGKWFGEWRDRYRESYTGAWGGLGLVGTWEFWVRLELVGWNPLEDARSLDSFSWYSSLYEYSRPSDEDESMQLGPDGDLVSAMISTALVPRLCKLVEGGALDPYSARSIRAMLDLAEQVEASVERLKFHVLLKSIIVPFRNAVDHTKALALPYLTLNESRFDPEAIPARRRFLSRCVKLLQNLLRWRKYTGELFGIGELSTRLAEAVIVPIARSGWDVGGEACVQKVKSILPNELQGPSIKDY